MAKVLGDAAACHALATGHGPLVQQSGTQVVQRWGGIGRAVLLARRAEGRVVGGGANDWGQGFRPAARSDTSGAGMSHVGRSNAQVSRSATEGVGALHGVGT
eukprot:1178172-Alexandrium_andersonii.AAC.1